MRILSLHNVDKFGCFSSINDKIINNLPRWGHFQPNFQWPLAAKLKKFPGEMMARTTCMQNFVEIERRTLPWEYRVWCFYRQNLPEEQLCQYFLLTGWFLGFFAPQGRHVTGYTLHRSRWNLAGRRGPFLLAKYHLRRFMGVGLRPPKLKKFGILPI